jgi:shikimate 5-dehydrogenase
VRPQYMALLAAILIYVALRRRLPLASWRLAADVASTGLLYKWAARAALFGIRQRGGISLIINRTPERGAKLAKEFGVPFYPLSQITGIQADGLINTTPVGMTPDKKRSPLARKDIGRFRWVMDCIYNPLQTQLLKDAEEAGSTAINGLGMFVHQGAEQIRIWTGKEPPRELMREVVLARLKEADGD